MFELLDNVPLDLRPKCRGRYTNSRGLMSRGEWQAVSVLETGLHLDHEEVASLHWQAQ